MNAEEKRERELMNIEKEAFDSSLLEAVNAVRKRMFRILSFVISHYGFGGELVVKGTTFFRIGLCKKCYIDVVSLIYDEDKKLSDIEITYHLYGEPNKHHKSSFYGVNNDNIQYVYQDVMNAVYEEGVLK